MYTEILNYRTDPFCLPFCLHYEINSKEYEVEYDLDNRIIKVDVDNNDVEYRYDALGRRVIRKEGSTKTALLWWGNSECAEYEHGAGQSCIQNDIMSHPSSLNSVIARAVDGSKFDLEWYHKNYLDHVYAVSDDTGNLDEHYRYTAFGEVTIYNGTGTIKTTSQINNTIMWNTRRLDTVSGYYLYKYRHYDPQLGRWPSRDPIEEAGGVNLYGFVGNDPIGRWDKLGQAFSSGVELITSSQHLANGGPAGKTTPHFEFLVASSIESGKCWKVKLSGQPKVVVFYNTNPDVQGVTDDFGRGVVEHEALHVSVTKKIYASFRAEVNPFEKYFFCSEACAQGVAKWVALRTVILNLQVGIANQQLDITAYNDADAAVKKAELMRRIGSAEADANQQRDKIKDCKYYTECPLK
jgi:RHS repeat-associated protein